jgi:hypothetical protein
MNRKVVDTFNGGIKLERGTKVEFDFPYKGTGTYLYPSMGVSNLTNANSGLPRKATDAVSSEFVEGSWYSWDLTRLKDSTILES